jgi:2-polyprenyl-6-hydroxyphenyl methylase/3-demethylubiquinone-9 3-methyltransferase
VNAQFDPAELAKFDTSAHRYWEPDGEYKPLHRLNPVRLRFVAERTTVRGARALDVGCGGGLLSEGLSRLGANVTGIDLAPGMIELAKLHALESGLRIDYRLTSAADLLATKLAPFEVVTCMEMLEHVPDPAGTLATVAQLTRPGGDVFVSTINRNLKSFALAIVAAEYVAGLVPRGTHEYERLIQPAELARFGRAAGLTLQGIAGLEYDPVSSTCALTSDPAVNYIAHFRAAEA